MFKVDEKGAKGTITPKNIAGALGSLIQIINKAMFTGPVVVTVEREARSLNMNAKQHAMYSDIASTTELRGRKYKPEVWKELLVDAFEKEYELSVSEKLPKPGEWVMSLCGNYPVRVRPATAKFGKKIGSMLIIYLYQKGDEYGATFKDSSLAHYEEAAQYLRNKTSD
jgi:hypothetical protein